VPVLATYDGVDDVLVIDPGPATRRPTTPPTNIAALDAAVAAIPGTYRRKVLVRLDGPASATRFSSTSHRRRIKDRSW